MYQMNATQVIGIAVFLLVALMCIRTYLVSVPHRPIWAILAFVIAGLTAEVIFGGRHQLTRVIGKTLKAVGFYDGRWGWQFALLVGLLSLTIMVIWLVSPMLRNSQPMARLAAFLASTLMLLFGIEAISLHSVDAILYNKVGPVLLIGWVWAGLGAAISICAWSAGRSKV
jgi:hypothetical protein